VCFPCDDTSVTFGREADVASRLQKLLPKIISWQSSNHRLDFAVSGALDEIQGIKNFQIFVDTLCSLYHHSPKTTTRIWTHFIRLEYTVNIRRIPMVHWAASTKRIIDKCLVYAQLSFQQNVRRARKFTKIIGFCSTKLSRCLKQTKL
jgi:hypothetical protein